MSGSSCPATASRFENNGDLKANEEIMVVKKIPYTFTETGKSQKKKK